ncbi:glycosyltransferase family 61 protein [Blastopirellula sp. J2-11]|uniref:glycosyltransferase family 61 protein n=1 Tax=Blastopirellula sp. J2-11 TaxID=2943192 RepID=UPI0021C782B6|nr:glycosyltransferase family 61 protein [Blastopirellula sp. J2-11]UUO04953.1 glycosyltransferase family 61 protein [Blastopirellula sp. J2-11]
MRLKSEAIKKLRSRLLNAWWRQFGVPAPTGRCLDSPIDFCLEEPTRQSYPRRTMCGATDQVDHAVESLISTGLLNEADRNWNGESTIDYPQGGIALLEQGSVISRQGVLLAPKHGVLENLGGGSLASISGVGTSFTHLPRPRRIDGNVLVMTRGLAQRNYYHWTFEMLSQLRLVEQAGVSFDYVAAPKRHAFALESLQLLGIERSQILPMGRYTHIQATQLIVPSVACYYPQPAGVDYLREKMQFQSWSHYEHDKRIKLYIARRRHSSRHIVNDAELFAALKPLGFRQVYLEDLPLKKQIQLFQQASVVVGPHGAGLSNLVYSRPGTAIFEITPTCRPPLFFHYLAEINALRYAVYFGQPVGQRGVDANIRVDVPQMRQQLTNFLEQTDGDYSQAAA